MASFVYVTFLFLAVTTFSIEHYIFFLTQDAAGFVCKKTAQQCERVLEKKKWLVFFSFLLLFFLTMKHFEPGIAVYKLRKY